MRRRADGVAKRPQAILHVEVLTPEPPSGLIGRLHIGPILVVTAIALTALLHTTLCGAAEKPKDFGGATPLQWSVRMADSETERMGDRRAWRPGRNVKWDYTAGLFTLSLLKQHPRRDSIAMKRRACGWNENFLLEVLTGTTG